MKKISSATTEAYRAYLVNEEKSPATVEKYTRDVKDFALWLGKRPASKALILEYKAELIKKYAPASVNAALSSLNSFFSYIERGDLRVKSLKIQKQIFSSEEKELTKAEYMSLLRAAAKKRRLSLLMQTICSTGIRVSELRHITVEAARCGATQIRCKGKHRRVFLPKQLCLMLLDYARTQKIKSGAIFITKNGNPLDRSNIWSDMKKLCKEANVPEKKVFPHNLRHLFARTFYGLKKDIVRLADVLGHSSVNTTRIYTAESGSAHRRQLQKLGLLLC